jgi:hypothetical protein
LWAHGRNEVLYALLAGTELRIGGVLAIKIGESFNEGATVSTDRKTITVRRDIWRGSNGSHYAKNGLRRPAWESASDPIDQRSRLTSHQKMLRNLIQLERFVGSPGSIRTSNPSVNSREDRKSKCPIWCRLGEIGSHFSFFSCTHTCTHAYDVRMGGHRSPIRLVEVADLLALPPTELLARFARFTFDRSAFARKLAYASESAHLPKQSPIRGQIGFVS